jgi:hypothetical protein
MARQRKRSAGEFEDEIKTLKQRNEALSSELHALNSEYDNLSGLVTSLREHCEDVDHIIENWAEAFGMVMTDSGGWTWEPWWNEHKQLVADYNKLVRLWNQCLPLINKQPRNIGRPLAASDAQVIEVHKLRKAGRSLRGIAEDTSLGLDTVRTIVGKMSGKDRTTKKHRGRLEPIDLRPRMATWKRQQRTGDALPKQVNRAIEEGRELIRQTKL